MAKITLNEDQEEAFKKLQSFIDDESSHMYLLEGAAGTGKTTTLSQFVEWADSNNRAFSICMCSPTHKALRVIKDMCPHSVKNKITFSTLHSMLGLKHEITKDGKEIFVPDRKMASKFPFFDLVIVDESSMIDNQLFNEMENQNANKTKILFIGDSNQINPVNHSISIPMSPEKREKYKIGYSRLNKIVRQAENNPIIKYSQSVIHDSFSFDPGTKDMIDETGVLMISTSQQDVILYLLKYYFKSEKFDEDANYCKIVAWRNATVDAYNKTVRALKYGRSAEKIVLNEKLIVDRPIKGDTGDKTIFNTNDDLVVDSLEVKEKKIFNTSWMYYDCTVFGGGDNRMENIHILHESEESKYKKALDGIAKEAKDETDPSKRIRKWKDFFSFQENFAQVKYNYSITAHNSQGSTYENCMVVYSDIVFNRRKDEAKRILYTAMTRPKKMLYIL
jgi:DNA polymerase III delta prime subunit